MNITSILGTSVSLYIYIYPSITILLSLTYLLIVFVLTTTYLLYYLRHSCIFDLSCRMTTKNVNRTRRSRNLMNCLVNSNVAFAPQRQCSSLSLSIISFRFHWFTNSTNNNHIRKQTSLHTGYNLSNTNFTSFNINLQIFKYKYNQNIYLPRLSCV